jgi:hypothetical protein
MQNKWKNNIKKDLEINKVWMDEFRQSKKWFNYGLW